MGRHDAADADTAERADDVLNVRVILVREVKPSQD
jgi:hypothetical protein